MLKKWPGILILDEIKQIRNNEVIFEKYNIHNILHVQGESQILKALFTGGSVSNNYIPSFYYLGLDNRAAITENDTYASISGEPSTTTGYARQGISSTSGFTIVTSGTTVKAKSNLIAFSATSSSWGPVKNIFLTNVVSGTPASAVLYSSIEIGSAITVAAGDQISLIFSMSLKNC
jgi:hypothetical protein